MVNFYEFLGAWWALQEGSWGGWWNWDASEVFGLIVLTYLLTSLHSILSSFMQTVKLIYVLYASTLTLFTYGLLQMGYSVVSHNFGLSLIGYGYTQLAFTLLIVLVFLGYALLHSIVVGATYVTYTFFKNLVDYALSMYMYKFGPTKPYYTLVCLFSVLLTMLYIISFNPVIGNIFWESLHLEFFNQWLPWLSIKLVLLLLLITYQTKTNLLIHVNYILHTLLYWTCSVPFIYHSNLKIYIPRLLHLLCILLLVLPLLLQTTTYSYWELITGPAYNWTSLYSRSPIITSILIENTYLINRLPLLFNDNVQNVTSFFWFHHNLDTQFFSLLLTDNILTQSIYNNNYIHLFKVSIQDSTSVIVDITSAGISAVIFKLWYSKLQIVF